MYESPSGAKPFSLDPKLRQNLDILLNAVMQNNQDMFIVIDGEEGSGKSQAARMLGLYCADVLGTPFDREGTANVHSSMEKYVDTFEKHFKERKRGMVGILDEGRAVLGKARFNSKPVKRFTDWISECREGGGVHIILLPAYHDLHKYVVLWRMNILIHMMKEYKEDREQLGGHKLVLGAFKMYANDEHLKAAFMNPYYYPRRWDAYNRFSNVEVMTPKGMEEIRAQKDTERAKRMKEDTETGFDKAHIQLNGILAILRAQGYEIASFAKILNVSKPAIYQRITAGKSTLIYQNWKRSASGDTENDEE